MMSRLLLVLVAALLPFWMEQSGKIIIRNSSDMDNAGAVPTIVWTDLTEAGDSQTVNGQQKILYDPISGKIYQYGADNSGIYSNAVFFGTISGNTYTQNKLSTSGGTSGCSNYPNNGGGWNNGSGSALQPWLSDRHPEFQTAIDSSRSVLYQWSGLACGNNGGDGTTHRDLWRLALNATTDNNTWTKVTAATQTSTIDFAGSMVYVPGNDVLVMHTGHSTGVAGGAPETWVLCPTQGGSLNAGHTAAGCVSADVWARTYDDDGTCDVPCTGSGYADMLYHSGTNKIYLFVLSSGNAQVWTYHITNKTWAQLSPSNPPNNSGTDTVEQVVTLATAGNWSGKMLYHRTCHNAFGGCNWVATFLFDAAANNGQGKWTQLKTEGTGPGGHSFITYAPNVGTHGALIAYEPNGGVWWKGVLQ